MNIRILNNNTVIDDDGKIIFFDKESFEDKIISKSHCFICGKSRETKEFNDEHIIPNWILRRYNLHDERITLPNSNSVAYRSYTVPCCVECNTLLSEEYETPISALINDGYQATKDYISINGPGLFFKWLSLIFFKVYLKTTQYRYELDFREDDSKISDYLFWESMHHINCIVRSVYTNVKIDCHVLGSFLMLPIKTDEIFGEFDYADNFDGKGILLRLGDIAFISILNDSSASYQLFLEKLESINSSISPIQLREILSVLVYYNLSLKVRPEYFSEFEKEKYLINAELPKNIEMSEFDNSVFGEILYKNTEDIVAKMKDENKAEIIDSIKKGHYSFLFDNQGRFIENPIINNKDKI